MGAEQDQRQQDPDDDHHLGWVEHPGDPFSARSR
jgi:hypothetical protein